MINRQQQNLEIGETVYSRWHGDNKFIVVRMLEGPAFPHYVCKLSSLYAVEETWVFPLIHLSVEPITKLTGSHNRKQLSIFTDGNIPDPERSERAQEK